MGAGIKRTASFLIPTSSPLHPHFIPYQLYDTFLRFISKVLSEVGISGDKWGFWKLLKKTENYFFRKKLFLAFS